MKKKLGEMYQRYPVKAAVRKYVNGLAEETKEIVIADFKPRWEGEEDYSSLLRRFSERVQRRIEKKRKQQWEAEESWASTISASSTQAGYQPEAVERDEVRRRKQRRISWSRDRDRTVPIESCKGLPLWHHAPGSTPWRDGCERRVQAGRLYGEDGTKHSTWETFLCMECGFERTAVTRGIPQELVQWRRCAKKRRQEIPREEWREDLILNQIYKQMQSITQRQKRSGDEPLSQREMATRRWSTWSDGEYLQQRETGAAHDGEWLQQREIGAEHEDDEAQRCAASKRGLRGRSTSEMQCGTVGSSWCEYEEDEVRRCAASK